MKRLLLRPTLLEFLRIHLILTALGAVLTVLVLVLGVLTGAGDALRRFIPDTWPNASQTMVSALPALLPLGGCLIAYLPVGRLVRARNLWERPGVADALLLLLVPAAAFWALLALAVLIPHGSGIVIAAVLLNSPAYGLFFLWSLLTGWGMTAPGWTGYAGGLISGLLPPLLYLIGSCLPIRAIDQAEEEPVKKG